MLRAALLATAIGLTSTCAWAEDWPQFRGPRGDGVTQQGALPSEWGKDQNIQWKVKLAGYGWSSPIVWKDRVFVTSALSDKQRKPSSGFGGGGGGGGFGKDRRPPDEVYQFIVYCLNAADGKVIWMQTAAERKPTIPIHGSNTYATETPVTDGERVYAYFGMTGLYCFDMEGKLVWKADLGSYSMAMGYGTGSSPVLHDGRLFIQCDNEQKSFLAALDARTGKELWRTPRPERTSWSTPFIWKNKSRTELVCLGSPKARSYEPATGKQLWELGGLVGQPHASMVASDEVLYLGTGGAPRFGGGFGGAGGANAGVKPLFAVKAGAAGDITLKDGATSSDHVAWSQSQAGPGMASPILYKDHLYILDQRGGLLTCLEARTGKQLYKERIGGRGFTSSPWAYEGKLFCLADDGTTTVVQAGPEFKVLGKNSLDEMCWSSPAVAGGSLFLRTVDHLYCIRAKR